MSYSACSSSGLLFTPAGQTAPVGAVGYFFDPVATTSTAASGATLQVIPSTVVPKGIWLVTGCIHLDATTSAATLVGSLSILKNGTTTICRWSNTTAQDSISISLSSVFNSDGDDEITIPAAYNTSTGTYGVSAAPLSRIQITRIA